MPAYDASWYVDGSVTVTNGSDVVVGSGTLWETQVRAGDMFALLSDGAASEFYEILAVTDNTHLQLRHAWPSTTTADADYAVVRNFTGKWSVTAQVASSLAAHIREFKLTLQNNLKGDQGDPGADGNTILSGSGDPTVGQGVDDDWYLNFTSNDFYRKEAGAWVLRTNLQGPQGDAGVDGNRWHLASADPGSSTGNPGDYALNTTSGDVFSRAAGGWSAAGNLKGPTGAAGADGADGAEWFVSSGAPSGTVGDNGDFCVDSTTGNFYKKVADVWVLQGSLKGTTGAQGIQGTKGDAGTSIYSGDGAPSDSLYANGDLYVDLLTGDVYKKTAGAWITQGNIKGPTGAQGSVWYSSAGTPSAGSGVNGDFYVNSATGDYYKKVSGAWVLQGSLIGPAGPAGSGSGDMLTEMYVDPETGRIKTAKAAYTEGDLVLNAIIYG